MRRSINKRYFHVIKSVCRSRGRPESGFSDEKQGLRRQPSFSNHSKADGKNVPFFPRLQGRSTLSREFEGRGSPSRNAHEREKTVQASSSPFCQRKSSARRREETSALIFFNSAGMSIFWGHFFRQAPHSTQAEARSSSSRLSYFTCASFQSDLPYRHE